jgi:hypothetical protein
MKTTMKVSCLLSTILIISGGLIMGGRLLNSQEDALAQRVSTLRTQLNAEKEAQIIGGSSLAIKKNQTVNPVDLTFAMTGTFPQTVTEVHVAFVPAKNGDAYAELTVQAYRDNASNKIDAIIYDDPTTATAADRTGWVIYIDSFDTIINGTHDFTNAAHTYYFKFFVNSVEQGTISWSTITS